MTDIGDMIAIAMRAYLLMLVGGTAAITAGLIYGIPWAWHLLKPLLHRWTS
jgi:hypothetical protein